MQVDEYHELLEMVENKDSERFNTIQRELEKDIFDIRWAHPSDTYLLTVPIYRYQVLRIRFKSVRL
jgi:hypothetical protein